MKQLSILKDIHKNKTANIIGCGESILSLKADDLQKGIIIALNAAILQVRKWKLNYPVYTMQKDHFIIEPQKREVLLLHKHESAKRTHNEMAFVFNNDELGLSRGSYDSGFSQQSAIRIAEYLGCNKIAFYGFDSITKGSAKRFDDLKRDMTNEYERQSKGMKDFDYKIAYEYHS